MIIYKITNTINDKIYIGQTVRSLKERWSSHKNACYKSKSYFYNAMRKYGIDNFKIEEIGGANSQSELNYQEWLLIYKYDSLWPNGYNTIEGGGNTGKWCKQKREDHSYVMKKRNLTPWNKGSKGICKGNRTSFKKHVNKGKNNLFYGKKHTEETKIALSKGMNKNKRPVINIETGEVFDSIKQTSTAMCLDIGNLWKVLNGNQKTIKGYKFKYLDKKEK